MGLLKPVLTASVLILAPAVAIAAAAPSFEFEQQARQHCPGDTVVWVNPVSGTYIFQDERWYGSTRHGAFVCRREGDKAGYRPRHEPARDRASVKRAALPGAESEPAQ